MFLNIVVLTALIFFLLSSFTTDIDTKIRYISVGLFNLTATIFIMYMNSMKAIEKIVSVMELIK